MYTSYYDKVYQLLW